MKRIFTSVLIHIWVLTIAQQPEIKNDLPIIFPPSPTVAALMKFEEIPVSNYTGVPNISLPLFSTATRSKDVNISLSLAYHPASIAAEEVASDIGLGWNLNVGGTISRVVRGLPDEASTVGTSPSYGVHHTYMAYNGIPFSFYQVIDYLEDPPGYTQETDAVSEYLWEANYKRRYDTDHDLWQFNFQGYTGRFFIKKNVNGELIVVPLDKYNLKIEYEYVQSGPDMYQPVSFTIYDDKGIKYVFEEFELTAGTTFSSMDYRHPAIYFTSSISQEIPYRSAFHLTQIVSPNNQVQAEFSYLSGKECNSNYSETTSYYNVTGTDPLILSIPPQGPCPDGGLNNLLRLKPYKARTINRTVTQTRKILSIDVPGHAKIEFTHAVGREDENMDLNHQGTILKEIKIRPWQDTTVVQRYKFEHHYLDGLFSRLGLRSVEKISRNHSLSEKHLFEYESPNLDEYTLNTDFWGYLTGDYSFKVKGIMERKVPSPTLGKNNILRKIVYPTGGAVLFNFEANTYSFIGNQPIDSIRYVNEDFEFVDEIVKDFYIHNGQVRQDSPNGPVNPVYELNYSDIEDQRILIQGSITKEESDLFQRNFKIYRDSIPTNLEGGLTCTETGCWFEFILKKGHHYYLKLDNFDISSTQVHESVDIKYYSITPRQYEYGGGNRIKAITYFSEDVSQDADLIIPAPNTVKRRNYAYRVSGNPNLSSGSLAFLVPDFEDSFTENPCFVCAIPFQPVGYEVYTSYNMLLPIRTHGSDVGYDEVEVSESGNGRIHYEFSSPIDVPETGFYRFRSVVIPGVNKDYKRGLPEIEKIYNEEGDKLREVGYKYAFEDFSEITGIRIFKSTDCASEHRPANYAGYAAKFDLCQEGPMADCGGSPLGADCACLCFCGEVMSFLSYPIIEEAYGWVVSKETSTTDFLSDGSVTHQEWITYNPANMQVASVARETSTGNTEITEFFYHTGNSPYSDNRISEIERIKKSDQDGLISESKIVYSDSWTGNASYLPAIIQTYSAASAGMEDRVVYERYDEYGNPLQYRQKDGTRISIIWGYDSTKPIAKIENKAYDDIPSGLISAAQADPETSLGALRTALTDAMVTTYTYIPLVGIKTVTDPKGATTTYEYDDFGRLVRVIDNKGNPLSENEYHLRTQN